MTHRTLEQLLAEAEALEAKAQALTKQADVRMNNNPGSFVTGRSGRTRRQDKRWEKAADRSIDNLVTAATLRKDAEQLRQRAYLLERADEIAAKKERQKAAEEKAVLQERVAKKAMPLVNDPAAPFYMTMAEWNAISRDYKSIAACGTYKERSAVRPTRLGGGLCFVFITDKPIKLRPKKEEVP